MIRHSGTSPASDRWSSPGINFRLARSPLAPNSTMTCGFRGDISEPLTSAGSVPTMVMGGRYAAWVAGAFPFCERRANQQAMAKTLRPASVSSTTKVFWNQSKSDGDTVV